jgi:hypothetical protein
MAIKPPVAVSVAYDLGGTGGGPPPPPATALVIFVVVPGAAGTYTSIGVIPAGNRVVSAEVEVLTPFAPGATIEVGTPAAPTAFQTATDNTPDVSGIYLRQQDTLQAVASPVRVTVVGPAGGSAQVLVSFTPVLT